MNIDNEGARVAAESKTIPDAPMRSFREVLTLWTESVGGICKLLGMLTLGLGTLAFVLHAWNIGYLAELRLDSLAGVLLSFAVIGAAFAFGCVLLVILPGFLWMAASLMAPPRPKPFIRPGIYFGLAMSLLVGWMLLAVVVPDYQRWTVSLAVLIPCMAYAVYETFLWWKRRPKAGKSKSLEDRLSAAVCEFFGLAMFMFPLLFFLKIVPPDATVPEVVPGAVFYGFFAVVANAAIASYFDFPARVPLETKRTVRLVFWGVTVTVVVGVAQALILGSVMRVLSLGNVPDYQLLVKREAAVIAAASGLVVTEIAGIKNEASGIFRITDVQLVTSIGPYYVLEAQRQPTDKRDVTDEQTHQYVLISKDMALGAVLNATERKRLMR